MASTRGTIQPASKFNAEKAATKIHSALRGLGTDGRMIIEVLTSHSSMQRQEIKRKYASLFGKSISNDFKEELGGDFEDTALALLVPYCDYIIECLHNALKKNDENCIVDALCTCQPWEIREIKSCYKTKYGVDLDEELAAQLSGDFGKLVTTFVNAENEELPVPDDVTVQLTAQKLFDGGVDKLFGTDEDCFLEVVCQNSTAGLLAIANAYELIAGHKLRTAIQNEFSGAIGKALFAIVCSAEDIELYFAERLNQSVRGLGTDDKTLIRILVTRSELDLEDIKLSYFKHFGKDLSDDVAADTSGDYRKLLLKILAPRNVHSSIV